jgi:arylsulfatase A-like enzyme
LPRFRSVEFGDKQPYFLACGFFRPHLPWYVPQKYFDLYPIDEILVPATTSGDLDDLPAEALKLAAARRNDFEAIKKAGRWKYAIQAYLASISYADAQIGRVLDALDARPNHHRTIIILWSDHGWHLGEKEHWHKSTLWEAATRVPLIISAPNHRSGVCDQPVSLLDLYPTLCELCRMQPTPDNRHRLDGISLAPLLRDPETPWNRPAVIEYKFGNAAVRGRRYRYIRYRDGGEELYDHDSDSEEWTNLADDPQFVSVKQALAKWITRRWAEPAATKQALRFDPQQYTWTHRESGVKTMGK